MLIPTAAERARTTVRLSPYLRVRTPGACVDVDLHGTDPDGSVVLVVAEDDPVVAAVRGATGDLPVLVDAADLCPVPVADRVRGRVRLVGWVHEPPEQLRRELALVAADQEGAGALLDIGRGRTVLYVDVVEVLFADAGDDPDDVGSVEFVRRRAPSRRPAPADPITPRSAHPTRPVVVRAAPAPPDTCETRPSCRPGRPRAKLAPGPSG